MPKFDYIVKDKFSFKLYPHLKEGEVLTALLRELNYYNLPNEVEFEFINAWNSRFWEVSGYDGATGIKNKKHPSIANFLHDYYYRMGYGGKIADIIYFELLKLTGYTNFVAKKRYVGIRTFGSYFRLRNYLKGNVNVKPHSMLTLYNKLKE